MARLRGVRRIHVLDRDACFRRLVLDAPLQSGERPRVKPTVHVLPVVETLTDVRQVLHHQHRILVLHGVLDGLPRRLLHDVGERVLVVREAVFNPPLGCVTLLEAFQGRVHLFAEMLRSTSATHERVSRRTVLEGTARNEGGFSDV